MTPSLQDLYHEALSGPAVNPEHLQTLYQLARQCCHVTAIGTEPGGWLRAFLYAQPEALVCCTSEAVSEAPLLEAAAGIAGRPCLEFRLSDSFPTEIEATDLLFLALSPSATPILPDLAPLVAKVRRYLVLSSPASPGQTAEPHALGPALQAFLDREPHWRLTPGSANPDGLTILTRTGAFTAAFPAPAGPEADPPTDASLPACNTATRVFLASPSPSPLLATPHVAVVVPIHNARPFVERCLRSIGAAYPSLPLILVDDGSRAETHDWLRQFLREPSPRASHRVLLRNGRQQLFTRSVNRGIRWAAGLRRAEAPLPIDFVAVVNSDCFLHPGALEALLDGMADPEVGVVGYCERPDGQEPPRRELGFPGYINGHCLLLRVRMLEEIGVLCETDTSGRDCPDFAPYLGQAHYASDRVFSWRAQEAGWKTLDCHDLLCAHAGARSWEYDMEWLSRFNLQPLWSPCDTLEHPSWVEPSPALP